MVLESAISNAGFQGSKAPLVSVQRGTALAGYNRRTVGQGTRGRMPQAEVARARKPMRGSRDGIPGAHVALATYKCALRLRCGTTQTRSLPPLNAPAAPPGTTEVQYRIENVKIKQKARKMRYPHGCATKQGVVL